MKTEQYKKIGMSLVLTTVLSLATTGCSSSDTPASSGNDVTVERGKVYNANVVDASTPPQVAKEKANLNVYTFAKAPVFPVTVTGGWIDVNDNGVPDANDTKLDITMKSYGTTVTPVTTFIADANETVRQKNLDDLVAKVNASTPDDANITAEELLQLPSKAKPATFVTANAIYQNIKINGTATLDGLGIDTLYAFDLNATALEEKVVSSLKVIGNLKDLNASEIDTFKGEMKALETPKPTTGGTASLNLDAYDFIYINKNTSGLFANAFISSTPTNAHSSLTNTSCEELGFTKNDYYRDYQGENGEPSTKTYTTVVDATSGTTRVCTEADYAGTLNAGNSNSLGYYNISDMGQN